MVKRHYSKDHCFKKSNAKNALDKPVKKAKK
jgi:hypothetical protein